MKIEHECGTCYLNELCRTYLFNTSFLNSFRPDYSDWSFLSLKLQCTHKHPNKNVSSCCDCGNCANRTICVLGANKMCSWDAQLNYLKNAADKYVSEHFGEAFIGVLCCKGFSQKDSGMSEKQDE